MYVCIYVCISVYVHIFIGVADHEWKWLFTVRYMHTHLYIHIHTQTRVCMFYLLLGMYVCMYPCLCVQIYWCCWPWMEMIIHRKIYTCVYVCMCVCSIYGCAVWKIRMYVCIFCSMVYMWIRTRMYIHDTGTSVVSHTYTDINTYIHTYIRAYHGEIRGVNVLLLFKA